MLTSLIPKYEIEQRIDIKVRMRDGTRLSTDIYLPKGKGPFPVILARTPYGNHDPLRIAGKIWMAQRGMAYAFQDCRGRHDSEGEWEPFRFEKNDGLDTLSWLSKQDFSNGNIGMMGGSYEGYCTWIVAPEAHPALKAIVPLVPLPDPIINVPYQNGAFFWNMIVWGLMVFGRTNQNVNNTNWTKFYQYLPLRKMDEAVGMKSRTWQNWMDHPTFDSWWKEVCYMHQWNKVNIPIMHICGWYDDDGISTYKNFPGMRTNGKNQKIRDEQRLIVGCWPHKLNMSSKVGEIDFGPQAVINLNSIILKFFARHLAGEVHDKKPEPKCRIFLMGENQWHGFSDWPIPKAVATKLYLHSNGNANSSLGDGVLSVEMPKPAEKTDHFTYDPKDPVPYVTDPISLQLGEASDQQAIERRMDVLVYSTRPLKEDTIICGRVFTELFISTDVKGTDFTAKLVDVWPNGKAIQICDGIQRAEFRNSLAKAEWLKTGEVYRITIDLWATGIRFLKGHQIRLEISSSAVPKFSPHLNTNTAQADETKPIIAHQTIYHTKDYTSALIIDVIPEKLLRETEINP